MDWATTIAGLIGIVLTYFFTKRHYEKKRKDEAVDRVSNRNIAEAREYVANWNSFLFLAEDITSSLFGANSNNDMRQVLASSSENINRLNLLLEPLTKEASILHILNDDELLDWHRKFLPQFLPASRYLFETIKRIREDEKFFPDKNTLKEVSTLFTRTTLAIARMKWKLDELERISK